MWVLVAHGPGGGHNCAMINNKRIELIFLWILPAIGIALAQANMPAGDRLAMLALPLTFAFFFIEVVARTLKLWAWHTHLFKVPLFLHRPFVWCGFFHWALILLMPWVRGPGVHFWWVALLGGVLCAALGFTIDVNCVEQGLFEIRNRAHYKNLGAVAVVRSYAFVFFGAFGALSMPAARFSHMALLIHEDWPAILVGAAAGLCVALPFHAAFGLIILRAKLKDAPQQTAF